MRKGVPNLGALQAFEASARLGSFSRAAEELSLTHSAVFRQVAGLEERLGVSLFTRVRRRIVLTEHGAEYAARVRHHLEQLQKDTFGLISRAGIGRSLHIGTLPTLATTWLIPRLADFQRLYPDIDISLSVKTAPFLFKDYPVDAAIYHAEQPWNNTHSIRLFYEQELIPVCSSQLLARVKSKGVKALPELTHLHMVTRPDAWMQWYEHNRYDYEAQILAGPRYEEFSMLLAAVDAGLGMGLFPAFIAKGHIKSGRFVMPVPAVLPVEKSYYFGYPDDRKASEALNLFEQWLVTQALQPA
ncbi:LysR substrate-binding domain-containing protein [Advenella sp. RU8]|uniref:LysR substrate-binding domain-containing protein n=1 Tax=Advenella sp. RU8 TaxID=3399575 RepID=UPI003AAFAECB